MEDFQPKVLDRIWFEFLENLCKIPLSDKIYA